MSKVNERIDKTYMTNVKQVLVVRKDLNMRKGKISSQCSHSSLKVFFDKMIKTEDVFTRTITFTPEELLWVDGIFTKICVGVNSEQELIDIYNKAYAAGLNCALIEDSGLTEFGGVKTKTCCCLGPNYNEKIDLITGNLSLL